MAKRPRTGLRPEDLYTGAVVLYNGDKRGTVSDAFAALDQFWVADEETGELVRNELGEIMGFSSRDLRLADEQWRPPPSAHERSIARVLVVGAEDIMLQVLKQFGQPDTVERRQPQLLLAVPCWSCECGAGCRRFESSGRRVCEAECPLSRLAAEGIDPSIRSLGKRLRPDIEVGLRPFHLKQAIEQVGPDLLRMEGYYCLSAVTLPHSRAEIEEASGWERQQMEEIRCQIDLGASAEVAVADGESLEDAAKRALQEWCGCQVADSLWTDEVQTRLRRRLGLDIPLKVWDGPRTKVFVLLVPEGAVASSSGGLLLVSAPAESGLSAKANEEAGGDLTIEQWKLRQDQFKHLPKLPLGWIRIKSRNSEECYYYNVKTNKSTFDFPLPEGWTKQKSKSTGKIYYFNAKLRKSVYEPPTE